MRGCLWKGGRAGMVKPQTSSGAFDPAMAPRADPLSNRKREAEWKASWCRRRLQSLRKLSSAASQGRQFPGPLRAGMWCEARRIGRPLHSEVRPSQLHPVNDGIRHDSNICHQATCEAPDKGAFWSIAVCGNNGFMKNENNIVNPSMGKSVLNGDNELPAVKPVE